MKRLNGNKLVIMAAMLLMAMPVHAETRYQVSLDAKAFGLYSSGKYDEAFALYKRGIASYKTYAPLYDGIGHVYMKKHSFHSAFSAYSLAAKLEPSNTLYRIHAQNAVYAGILNSLATASELLYQASNVAQMNPVLVKNINNFMQSNYTSLEVLSDFYQGSTDVSLAKGNSALFDKNYGEAIKFYNSSLRQNKDVYKAYNNLGLVYMEQGKINEAVKFFKKALNYNSKTAMPYNNLAVAYYKLGDSSKAKMYTNKALSVYSSYSPSLNNKAVLIVGDSVSKLESAIHSMESIVSESPDAVPAIKLLANMYLTAAKYKPALDTISKGRPLINDNPMMLKLYGDCLALNGSYSDAIFQYRQAISITPKDGNLFASLAKSYDKKGDSKNAVYNYQYAMRMGSQDSSMYKNYGNILVSLGRDAESKAAFRKYLDLHPNAPDARLIDAVLKR